MCVGFAKIEINIPFSFGIISIFHSVWIIMSLQQTYIHTLRSLKTLVCYCYVKVLYVNTSTPNLTHKKG